MSLIHEGWSTTFPNKQIKLQLPTSITWTPFFEQEKTQLERIQNDLSEEDFDSLLPLPKNVFKALDLVPLDEIKVVILGQDPYHTVEKTKNGSIILATGLSFSIPSTAKIPSSLRNIYANQIKFGHITKQGNGNFDLWCNQGCLLLNTSLTVTQGNPNCHKKLWANFTDSLIQYISNNTNNVVFMLWGAQSLSKEKFIDKDKHFLSVSSHPSGFSYDKPMGRYGSFKDTDHFGNTNKYLESKGKKAIIW